MIINAFTKIKKKFKFIFYLRYLIIIFIFSTFLLYSIPKIFKNVNKINKLNYNLKNQHGFKIENIDKIKYKIFPQPHFELQNSQISIGNKLPNLKIENLKIFVNLKGLYISEKLNFNNIKFSGNFLGNNLNGYYKPKKDTNLLYFEFENLGINAKVFFDNKKKFPKSSGRVKLKILNNNLLINFDYDKNLNFQEFIYKNEYLLGNLSGQFDFKPFFNFNLFAQIKKLNLKKIDLKKIYSLIVHEISNKKLNGKLVIEFLSNKTEKKNNIAQLLFQNGNIILKDSIFQFTNLDIQINAYLKKYSLYKDLSYELLINSENIDNFQEIMNLPKDNSSKKFKILIIGNINLDAKKYYFENITINNKDINETTIIKLKKYLDENTDNFFSDDLNKKNFDQFFKNLIQFILA